LHKISLPDLDLIKLTLYNLRSQTTAQM